MTLFSASGQTFFIALSTGNIRQAFSLTSGEYGSIYMLATLASAAVLPFLGRIVDHQSVGRVTVLTVIFLAAASTLLATSQSLITLIIALFGLRLFGQGMMTHISITAMSRWFETNRGKAISIASLGFNLGQAIFPIAFVALVAIVGWRQGWIIGALVLLVIALPSILISLAKERAPQSIADEVGVQSTSTRHWTRGEMLRDPYFWITSSGVLAPPFITTAIFFHQDTILAARGWSTELFAGSFSVLTIMSIASGLVAGSAIDRRSASVLLPLPLIPIGLGCVVLAFGTSSFALVLYMALFGIGMGVTGSIFGSLWPEIYGTKHLGAIRSLVVSLMVLSSALGPGVIGWAIDFGVSLSTQFVGLGIYCFIAAFALRIGSKKFLERQS